MSTIGMVKPVYMTRPTITIAAGAMAWEMVRDEAPIVRNIIDMVSVHVKEKRKKMKKWPGVRRRLVIK